MVPGDYMSTTEKLGKGSDVAVFTRNHLTYLEEACLKPPSERVAFRAAKRWATVEKVLRAHSPIDLYIAAIGAEGVVEFAADLYAVVLDPVQGQPRTDEMLALSLDATKSEGLWERFGKRVGTLY